MSYENGANPLILAPTFLCKCLVVNSRRQTVMMDHLVCLYAAKTTSFTDTWMHHSIVFPSHEDAIPSRTQNAG